MITQPGTSVSSVEDKAEPAKLDLGVLRQAYDKLARWHSWYRRFSPRYLRLQAGLIESWRRIHAISDRLPDARPNPICVYQNPKAGPDLRDTVQTCERLWCWSVNASVKGEIYVAYDCLLQIELELVQFCEDDLQRRNLWTSLTEEARQKLKGWRKAAVESIENKADGRPSVADLREIMWHIHSETQNMHHKLDLLRGNAVAVAVVIIVALALAVWALLDGQFDWLQSNGQPSFRQMYLVGTVAGIVGSVLSLSFKTLSADLRESIPTVYSAVIFAFLRASIGALVAFPILVLGYSGLLNLGDGIKPTLLLAACFIGGFSERFLVDQAEQTASSLSLTKAKPRS